MNRAAEPVSFSQLTATFQNTGFVNYFEFSDLISELLEQGHIVRNENDKMLFTLTEHGKETAENFYKKVPLAVRERCEAQLQKQLRLSHRMRENNVEITPTKDGFQITLEIPDIGTPLLRLSLFVPTRELCEEVRRRFLNDPLTLYKGAIALATGDVRSVAPLLPEGENLFE